MSKKQINLLQEVADGNAQAEQLDINALAGEVRSLLVSQKFFRDQLRGSNALLGMASVFQVDEHHTVESRGGGMFCVKRGNCCFTEDLTPMPEPLPSSRTQEFVDATRFDLNKAMDIAVRASEALEASGA